MITSRQNETIKEVVKLHTKKHRLQRGVFLVEGEKLFNEALKAGFELVEAFSTEAKDGVELVSDNVLKAIATTVTPQNLVAVFKQKNTNTSVFDKCIILDNVQDPSNMGSIIRSALGAGFVDIIAVNCVDKYDPKVIRASMGAIFHTNIIECELDEAISLINKNGLQLVVASMEGESIFDIDFPDRIAFVVGNEGNGVSKEFRNLTSLTFSIPMNEKLESLNVAVSSALLMYFYEFKKRR